MYLYVPLGAFEFFASLHVKENAVRRVHVKERYKQIYLVWTKTPSILYTDHHNSHLIPRDKIGRHVINKDDYNLKTMEKYKQDEKDVTRLRLRLTLALRCSITSHM